jgi:uncharacterized protein (TIGR03437 family)
MRSGVITTRVTLANTYLVDNGNHGLAADTDGTLYVQQGGTVAQIAPGESTLVTYAGGGTMVNPAALAVNVTTGDLAVADRGGNVVLAVGRLTGNIQTVAGLSHFAGDGGPAGMAIFNGLEGVAADLSGNLYVADVNNNRVRMISASGIVSTVAGNGVAGYSGDHGPATGASINMKHSAAFGSNVAVDALGNLYLSDHGNGRIRMVDTTGTITTVAGGGANPIAPGLMATNVSILPGPIAVDAHGNLYFGQVTGGGANTITRVWKVDGAGRLSVFAGNGQTGNMGDKGQAAAAQLGNVYCLATDVSGNVYLCDAGNNRVRQVSPTGTISGLAGNGAMTTSAIRSGPPNTTAIGPPNAVAVDGAGNIFIYTMATKQILEIDASGTLQPVIGASSNGAASMSTGDGSYAAQATFTSVGGMAADPLGNLWISDAGIYIREALPVASGEAVPPVISAGGIIGAGGSLPPVTTISPGGIATVYGSFFTALGNQRVVQAADIVSGQLPTTLAGICITIGGAKAGITGVFSNQLNVVVPSLPPGPAVVQATANCGSRNGVSGNRAAVAVEAASPEFFAFTVDPVSGKDPIAAVKLPAGSPIGTAAPVIAGATVEAYGTGWGSTLPAVAPMTIPGAAAQLASGLTLTLGGTQVPAANILYAGVSPCCAGLYQVDFTVPSGTPSGNLPLVVTVNGVSSPPNAYLAVGR